MENTVLMESPVSANTVSANPVPLPPLVEPAEGLSVDEVKRYSRHLIIPDVGMTGQKRLKNAKVLAVRASQVEPSALMNRRLLAVSKVTASASTQAATKPQTVSTRLG